MNRKNMILASKLALLFVLLGFCLPLCDESNGFQSAAYFLGESNNGLYAAIGYALSALFCLTVVSILYTVIKSVLLKKEYSGAENAVNIILFVLQVFLGVFVFTAVKNLPEEDVELAAGYYFIITGWVVSFVLYLYSSLLDTSLSTKVEERRSYWMLSLPAIIFYFGVMTFPTLFSVFLSFTNYGGGELFEKGSIQFIGLRNYAKVFRDSVFYLSLKNNLWVVLISVFGQLPLGFLLAYVLTRGLVKGRDFFQTMIYLPCVISTVVIGVLFQTFFSAHGAWWEIMHFFNPQFEWAMNSHPMVPVLFVILWMYTGTYLIIFLANLQKIDPQIMEAATIDGATEGQTLWYIIFPELSGVFVISAILAISGSLKSFDLIYVMTGGGPAKMTYVLSLYMFDKAFKGAADYPMANTISTIMVVISLVLIVIVKSLEKRFGDQEDSN